MKKIEFSYNEVLDVIRNKSKINDLLKDDGFYINLDGIIDSFYIIFQDFIETGNFGYCKIEDLCSGGAEPYNDDIDGDIVIYNSGLIENWVYNFWMPETEITDGQSDSPIKVIMSGYFVQTKKDGVVFYPINMEWNEEFLLEVTT